MIIKTARPKKHYVNNKDFIKALTDYQQVLLEKPDTRIPEYIGVCIVAICTKMATRPNFSGYSYKDEMIGDAIENCLEAVGNFDEKKSAERSRTGAVNAFGYFSWVAWNAFIRRIAKEKKQSYIKHKNMQNMFIEEQFFSSTSATIDIDNDTSTQIIDDFETKLTKTKKSVILGIEKFLDDKDVPTQ